ncbi:MAG TPA: PDC sensor domain-containing protein [Gemmatimonadales bacterium]
MRSPLALSLLVAALFPSAVASARQTRAPNNVAPPIMAQALVDQFVRAHPELAALELAVTANEGGKTVAATAPEDVGEKCDADELGPIRTGKPDVEGPTKADPVFDITQALHDAAGHLIGAVGMDLKPAAGLTIPSKAWLLGPARP